ncbi:MAG: Gfo/Idh/MocA family oxidoreductase, partial [Caldilineaceae bacterium]|nr:Gfo/Idh/MocA family oxidoreductase [Caldilineaceae bacterium]
MASKQRLGFALLGTGMVAEYHQKAVLANADLGAELVAVSHYDPQRFEAMSAKFDVPCGSYEETLADERVDVICICTPSGFHAEQAIAARAAS